jgi:hypothetical protein
MTYLPEIIEMSDDLIEVLIEDQFFNDYNINDHTYAKKRFCDELTKKYIDGNLDLDYDIFTDDELDTILKEIVAESMLRQLTKDGYVNSYEDETTEETFFLTKEGKKELRKK